MSARNGSVAHMVERVLCMHEARGSMPLSSILLFSYSCRRGLVGYDAALTQLRSRVRFSVFVQWESNSTPAFFRFRETGPFLFVICCRVYLVRKTNY